MADIWDVAWKIGLPFVMLLTALVSGRAGMWVWGRELEYERQQSTLREEAYKKAAQEASEEMRKDRDYYRDLLLETLPQAEAVATTAAQAVGLLERQPTSRRRGHP